MGLLQYMRINIKYAEEFSHKKILQDITQKMYVFSVIHKYSI